MLHMYVSVLRDICQDQRLNRLQCAGSSKEDIAGSGVTVAASFFTNVSSSRRSPKMSYNSLVSFFFFPGRVFFPLQSHDPLMTRLFYSRSLAPVLSCLGSCPWSCACPFLAISSRRRIATHEVPILESQPFINRSLTRVAASHSEARAGQGRSPAILAFLCERLAHQHANRFVKVTPFPTTFPGACGVFYHTCLALLGGIFLHWLFSVVLIVGPGTSDAYPFITNLGTYTQSIVKSEYLAWAITFDSIRHPGSYMTL